MSTLKFVYRDELHFRQEARADRHQSLLGPLVEPVDTSAVDYSGELATPDT